LSTDIAWEEWGRSEPYFGVITNPKFRRAGLTSEARNEFFESGRVHVEYVFEMIRKYINPAFKPASVVDFGCGVGRILVHFSPTSERVVGLDVSPSMLEEAKRNCDKFGVGNVQLLLSDDQLSALTGSYDLIHSFIVFQHIPPGRGREIFRQILPRISAGGVGALHFSYAKTCHAATHGVAPPAPPSVNRGVGASRAAGRTRKPGTDPEMQMNPYHLNEILFVLQSAGVRRFHVEFTDHGGELGVFLFFQVSP
jgi:SAM-dependent methyltransferase